MTTTATTPFVGDHTEGPVDGDARPAEEQDQSAGADHPERERQRLGGMQCHLLERHRGEHDARDEWEVGVRVHVADEAAEFDPAVKCSARCSSAGCTRSKYDHHNSPARIPAPTSVAAVAPGTPSSLASETTTELPRATITSPEGDDDDQPVPLGEMPGADDPLAGPGDQRGTDEHRAIAGDPDHDPGVAVEERTQHDEAHRARISALRSGARCGGTRRCRTRATTPSSPARPGRSRRGAGRTAILRRRAPW